MGVLCWTVSALNHVVRPINPFHAITNPPTLLNADALNSLELVRLGVRPVATPHPVRGIGRAVRKVIRRKFDVGHHTAKTIWHTAIVCAVVTPLTLLGAPLIEQRHSDSPWLNNSIQRAQSAKSDGRDGEEWSDTDEERYISAPEPTSLVIFGASVLIVGAAARHRRRVWQHPPINITAICPL